MTDLRSGQGGITLVAVNPSGTVLATADSNGKTYLWNLQTLASIKVLADPATGNVGVLDIAYNGAGTILAVGDLDGNAYLWRV